MDDIIKPSPELYKRKPKLLYLLHHENHFTVLIHHGQTRVKEFIQRVIPFIASDFMLENERLVETFKRDNRKSPSKKQVIENKLEIADVRLDENDLIQKMMPHNDLGNLICTVGTMYPYNEHEYIKEERKFLQKGSQPGKKKV